MFDGFGDIFQRISEDYTSLTCQRLGNRQASPVTWTTYLLLAMSAVMFLPRQFHVSVVENSDERHISTSMWFFPLYMLLINVFVLPIAMAGLLKGFRQLPQTLLFWGCPLAAGQAWLSVLVFIGGASAATGMILIESVTVSTMVTNQSADSHDRADPTACVPSETSTEMPVGGGRWPILVSYWFERQVGPSYMLVNME